MGGRRILSVLDREGTRTKTAAMGGPGTDSTGLSIEQSPKVKSRPVLGLRLKAPENLFRTISRSFRGETRQESTRRTERTNGRRMP